MPKIPAPYLTREPWLPFTPREKPRPLALKACPSSKCRRAKSCINALDNIYCQRTHESLPQFRIRSGYKAPPARTRHFTSGELEALRESTDQRLADIAIQKREMIIKWKSGVFNDSFGKYKPYGVLKHPPDRQYTEG